MAKKYTVFDGELTLTLEEAEDGWFVVTTPVDSGVVTQARDIPEAFEMARDALKLLRRSRAKWHREHARQQRKSA